jgi:phage major head subunit gpT-like protein
MARVVATDLNYAFLDGVQTIFQQALAAVPTSWQDLSTVIESDGPSETYSWMGQTAMPRAFARERVPRALMEQGFVLTNADYEDTIEVDSNAFKDDKTGQLNVRVRDLATRNIQFIDYLMLTKLAAGATDLCYDGLSFFNDNHVDPKAEYTTVQDNKFDLAVTDAATALSQLQAVLTSMRKFKDDRGIAVNAMGTHIVCAPALEFYFLQAMNSTLVPGSLSTTNVLTGRCKVVVNPWAATDTFWAVLDCSAPVRPLIYQHREGPTLDAYVPEGGRPTWESFMRKRYLWGTFLRCAVGYGDWRRAALGKA